MGNLVRGETNQSVSRSLSHQPLMQIPAHKDWLQAEQQCKKKE
jgi:hypothetical protein